MPPCDVLSAYQLLSLGICACPYYLVPDAPMYTPKSAATLPNANSHYPITVTHFLRCKNHKNPLQGQVQVCVREHAPTNLDENSVVCVHNCKRQLKIARPRQRRTQIQSSKNMLMFCVPKNAKNAKCRKCKTCMLKIHSIMKCTAMYVSGSAVHLHLA